MLHNYYSYDRDKSVKDLLLDDPSLLDDEVLAHFEISPVRDTILHGQHHGTGVRYPVRRPSLSWSDALRAFAAEGSSTGSGFCRVAERLAAQHRGAQHDLVPQVSRAS